MKIWRQGGNAYFAAVFHYKDWGYSVAVGLNCSAVFIADVERQTASGCGQQRFEPRPAFFKTHIAQVGNVETGRLTRLPLLFICRVNPQSRQLADRQGVFICAENPTDIKKAATEPLFFVARRQLRVSPKTIDQPTM